MIKYSVIVPAYNSAGTIEHCLKALTQQSMNMELCEVIVVDDGSTDRTGDIIKKFPVKYLRQPNLGPAAARNHGAAKASGEVLLFTDSDCVPDYRWVEEMTRPFADRDIAAVKGAYRTAQKALTARFAQVEFEERFELLKKTELIDMVDTYSAAFRREVFLGAGGFDESFPAANNEDTDLSYKLSVAGHKMVFNPGAIVCHLRHPDTICRYSKQKFWRGYWRMVVYRRFPDKMVKDSYTPQSLKLQVLLLFSAMVFALGTVILPVSVYPAIFLLVLFMLSALPFAAFAFKRDWLIGLTSAFFLAVRALSIGCGIIYFFYKTRGTKISV